MPQARKTHCRRMSLLAPDADGSVVFVVLGASGDLAKKKTFPALFGLYRNKFLPEKAQIIGYARTNMSVEDFHKRITEYLKIKTDEDRQLLAKFLKLVHYLPGQYDKEDDFNRLRKRIDELDGSVPEQSRHHIFYLALPPNVFVPAATCIKKCLYSENGINRLVVEKPFGHDLESSQELAERLGALFSEDEVYRIDHYLGKEMVKNMMVLRFANVFFGAIWNRVHIDNVQITFKESFGTMGRGGYFDQFGIIRDVMQNHLLQILSVLAMERPVTLGAEDVRNEKVKVLRCISPVEAKDVLLGQYTASADGKEPGYLDDSTVPKGSQTATYAAAVLHIHNDRWEGVPFILRCGKALDNQKTEVRIQFRPVAGALFQQQTRNELVIRVQPKEAVYVKMVNKKPGLSNDTVISELDLSYDRRYGDVVIPDAYESLLLDVINGDHSNFVRADELDAAWRIFTPLLHKTDKGEIPVHPYQFGTRGPKDEARFIENYGYVRSQQSYDWPGKL